MVSHLIAALLASGALALPAPTQAAPPDAGRGFWAGGGAALTSVGFGGDAADAGIEREGGLGLRGGAGYAFTDRLSAGGEANLWAKETDGSTATIWTLSAVAYFFPSPSRGWWLEGGLGVLVLDESDIGNRGSGIAVTAAVGHDFALGERWKLAPYFQAIFSGGVEIEQGGIGTGFTENPNLIQGGVAIFWR